jgi:hypothetical protein
MAKKRAATKRKTGGTEDKKALVLTYTGARPMDEVVESVKAAGFQVDQVLDAIGSITGKAAANVVPKLKKAVPGMDVSEDHTIDIGPPGAPLS